MVVYGVNQLLGWEPGNYDVFVAKNDDQGLFREINRRPGALATLAHPNRTDYGNLAGVAFSPRLNVAGRPEIAGFRDEEQRVTVTGAESGLVGVFPVATSTSETEPAPPWM